MRHLFRHLDKLQEELGDKYIILFLDYDGTLTPIVNKPEKALISKETRGLLKELSKKDRLKLAIISGRSLKDIKKIVGLNGITYVGNHGLEIEGPKIKFESPVSGTYKTTLEKIKHALNKKLVAIRGVFIEDKGLTLSVHYRLMDEGDELALKNIFYSIVKPYLTEGIARITYGKKVFEIRPPLRWDKGKAVTWLLARERFRKGSGTIIPIYVGDDLTDEDAFRRLRRNGVTVFIGSPRMSHAEYYVNNPREVGVFLKRLNEWLN